MIKTHAQLKRAMFHILDDALPYTHGAWSVHGKNLCHHVMNEKSMADFLRWSTMVATMVVGDVEYIQEEFSRLPDDIRILIVDSRFGNPLMICDDATSGSYCHQAFHLYQFMSQANIDMSEIGSIVEFGGGYGAMAVVASRLGFTGTYSIVDLPEISLLQRYYLDNLGLSDVETITVTEWEDRASIRHPDLMIATYSLSETKPDFRKRFFDTIDPHACLIAHQEIWEGETLGEYFQKFMDDRPQYDWVSVEHFHPSLSGHYYRIGVKRGNQ